MAQKRTVQDIYALITPNTPSDEEFSEGDEVQVQHRAERLAGLEWIEDSYDEVNSHFETTLTEVGAAILNYANATMDQGTFGEEIERGAGRFAQRARVNYLEEERWELVEVGTDEVVLENQMGEQRRYDRSNEQAA